MDCYWNNRIYLATNTRADTTGVVDNPTAPCPLMDADNVVVTNDAIPSTTSNLKQADTKEAERANDLNTLKSLTPIDSFICPTVNCGLPTRVNTDVINGKFKATTQQLSFNTNDVNDKNHPDNGR